MKRERGITLVSLVVTIIILIILASVSINLILGKNGIITMATQAKENTELAKIEEETALNELYMQIEAEGGISGNISYDAIAKLAEFKREIADYIENKSVARPDETKEASEFINSFEEVLSLATKVDESVAATADNISEGKQAWVNGQLIIGNGTDNNSNYEQGKNSVSGQMSCLDAVQTGWNASTTSGSQNYTIPEDGKYIFLVFNSAYKTTSANAKVTLNGTSLSLTYLVGQMPLYDGGYIYRTDLISCKQGDVITSVFTNSNEPSWNAYTSIIVFKA